MKLQYKRFVKQIVTDYVPNTQWLGLQARAFDLLKKSEWIESDVEDSELPANDPVNFSISTKYDAFKASLTVAGSGKEACAMGCAAYVFKIPQDAMDRDVFWKDFSLILSADKFNVSGLRIVTCFESHNGTWATPFQLSYEAPTWDAVLEGWPTANPPLGATWVSGTTTDAKGTYGILAERADTLALSSNKTDIYTLSKPTWNAKTSYISIIVGLQDYLSFRTDSTGKATREYWFEGSGCIVGSLADFTFLASVTEDSDSEDSPTMRQVYSSDPKFSPINLRYPVVAEQYGTTDTIGVLPVDIYQMSVSVPESQQYEPAYLSTEVGYKTAFFSVLSRALGTMKNETAPNSGTAQIAIETARISAQTEVDGVDPLERARLFDYGLFSCYFTSSIPLAQEGGVVGWIPQILSSILYFPVFTTEKTKSLLLVNSTGARTTNGAKVRLTAWFISSSVNTAGSVNNSCFQVVTRALAGEKDFWLGSSKTISAEETSTSFGAVTANATLLGSVDIPEYLADGGKITIPCSIDKNQSGWIVIAPFVVGLPEINIMRDDSNAIISHTEIDLFQCGLGHEVITAHGDEMTVYQGDKFNAKEFKLPFYDSSSPEAALFSLPNCRGWRPDIFIY